MSEESLMPMDRYPITDPLKMVRALIKLFRMNGEFPLWITAIRVLFLALLFLQSFILVMGYVGTYYSDIDYEGLELVRACIILISWLLSLLQGFIWLYFFWWLLVVAILTFFGETFLETWIVWAVYVATLMVSISCIIFGGHKLDQNRFWSSNKLKITICLTPFIRRVLLFSTARDHSGRFIAKVYHKLYGKIVLEQFDNIEVLAIVIYPEESKLPQGMVFTIIVLAAISLLLSPLELAEKKLEGDGDYKKHKRLYLARLVFKKFLVNLALLIVRLVAWLKYEQEASIFIIKNATIIVISFISIMRLKKWFGLSNDNKKRPILLV